jgi:cyclopropane fatty-acyl-phospholipid synthase-like methyltransferase
MSDPDNLLGSSRPERLDRFDAMYDAGPPPWDIGRPQPAFLELVQRSVLRGRVLDVGCGTGEHALMAAALGLGAVGIDAVPQAISQARRKAHERGLQVRFLVWDALRLPELGEHFDTVLDSGLFHVFDDDERARYVAALDAVITAEGHYYLLCFSDRQPGTLGPRRVSQQEIRAAFSRPKWRIDAIDAVTMDTNIDRLGVHAWRASITRLPSPKSS